MGRAIRTTGESGRAVAVAGQYENVFASIGVHPHDAKLYDEAAENLLIDLVKSSDKIVAWGDIELDFLFDHNSPSLRFWER